MIDRPIPGQPVNQDRGAARRNHDSLSALLWSLLATENNSDFTLATSTTFTVESLVGAASVRGPELKQISTYEDYFVHYPQYGITTVIKPSIALITFYLLTFTTNTT